MSGADQFPDPLAHWAREVAPLELVERRLHIVSKAEALKGVLDDPLGECERAVELARRELPPTAAREDPPSEGYSLLAVDWVELLREGVPEVEYVSEPYFPKGARIWIWGATGSYKSLYCAGPRRGSRRAGVRVSYFSEENPIQEELRRLGRLRPDPEHFRLFHRTGMDLVDPGWVESFLNVTRGDAIVFLDTWTDLWSGDESDNRAVQQFDASVLKPLQAQGVTPVILHHTGHRYMFSATAAGATAGRGASSLGQKADVTLEFKDAGERRFTIVYGKCRIGGVRVTDGATGRRRGGRQHLDHRGRQPGGDRHREMAETHGAGHPDGDRAAASTTIAAPRRRRRQHGTADRAPGAAGGRPPRPRRRREGPHQGRQTPGCQGVETGWGGLPLDADGDRRGTTPPP